MYLLGGKTEVPWGSCLSNPLCLCMVRAPSMFYKFISQGSEQISSTALGTSVCGWLWKGWLTSQRWWPFFFIVFYYSSEQKFLQLYFFILEAVYCPGLRWSNPRLDEGYVGTCSKQGRMADSWVYVGTKSPTWAQTGTHILICGQTGLSVSWAGEPWAGANPWQRVQAGCSQSWTRVRTKRFSCVVRDLEPYCQVSCMSVCQRTALGPNLPAFESVVLSERAAALLHEALGPVSVELWGITYGKSADVGLIFPFLTHVKKALQGGLVVSTGKMFF